VAQWSIFWALNQKETMGSNPAETIFIFYFFTCLLTPQTLNNVVFPNVSLDRYETLQHVEFLLVVKQCKLYASKHSSVIIFYENKNVEHVLRL